MKHAPFCGQPLLSVKLAKTKENHNRKELKKFPDKLTIDSEYYSFADGWRHAIRGWINEMQKTKRGGQKEEKKKCYEIIELFGFDQIIPMQRIAPFICRFACWSSNFDPLTV